MKKKFFILSLIFILLSLFSACSNDGVIVEEIAFFDSGDLHYAILKQVKVENIEQTYYAKVISYIGKECTADNPVISIMIPSTVTYEGVDYNVKKVGSLAFNQIKITQIDVEEGITDIENFAFGYCDMSVVNLPSTIQSIGDYAFVGCNSIGTMYLRATTPPTVGDYAFKIYRNDKNVYAVNAKLKIYVPSASLASYKDVSIAPSWSDYTGILLQY